MAWDPGSRANLSRLRRRGVVAVRYHAVGCNVELELLSNCIGTSVKYEFSPYSANEHKVAHNASELFAALPLGAASLSGKVQGNRALRTDYMLAGQYAVPPEATFKRSELRGVDCAKATHVVSTVYVGAFAMAAGERRTMDGSATVFGIGSVGGGSHADVEILGDEGSATACKSSQDDGKENERCGVPLRVGLVALDAPAEPVCPTGSTLQGDKCVRTNVVTHVDCPAGTKWDGAKCAASVDTGCAAGMHFESARGCVGNVVPGSAVAQIDCPPGTTAQGSRCVGIGSPSPAIANLALDASTERRRALLSQKLGHLRPIGLQVLVRNGRLMISIPGDLPFSNGSATLRSQGKQVLAEIALAIRGDGDLESQSYQVVCHTDNQSPPRGYANNEEFTLSRARAAQRFLINPNTLKDAKGDPVGGGLNAVRWTPVGAGELRPIAGTIALQDPVEMQKNRRIELVVQ
jgi:flagellar motor protein MotB